MVYTREGEEYLGVWGYTSTTVLIVISSVSVEYSASSSSSATSLNSSLLSALMPVDERCASKSEYTVRRFTGLLGLA